jgi:long-chain acyl-CoA synthetase
VPAERTVVTSYAALEEEGTRLLAADPAAGAALRDAIGAEDVATLIYTSGTTGLPKGVMLTHQNLSSNVVAAFTGLPTYHPGEAEVVLSFLPLTHIFARTLQYGVMWYGSSVYFSDPARVGEDLVDVRPTFFASVPRVLEKAYERIQAAGAALGGWRGGLAAWALARARAFDVEHPPRGGAALAHALADRLVYRRWRDALGGRLRTVIVGGAALRAELAVVFKAAGIDVLQGYGLTETSPVIAFNRPEHNRPGTVGVPLAGTEVAVSGEGEVLARGPHIMKGYYLRDDLTAEVIDAAGWFHTGDLGAIEDGGYVRITGRIKHLFKLSTGKYVMPRPIEQRLEASPLVDTALVIGEGEKYCTALLFVAGPALEEAIQRPLDASALVASDVQGRYRDLVAGANRDMPHWSTVKRFALVLDELTMESGHVTPKLSVRRDTVLHAYAAVVDALYHGGRAPAGVAVVEV